MICCAVAVVIGVDTGQLIGRAIVNLYGVVKSSVRLVETRGMFTCAYKAERISENITRAGRRESGTVTRNGCTR